eukprot:2791040-Karenia_brevis.AAC.1
MQGVSDSVVGTVRGSTSFIHQIVEHSRDFRLSRDIRLRRGRSGQRTEPIASAPAKAPPQS